MFARTACEAPDHARLVSVVIKASREHLGWVLSEFGRADADHTVLLLPGALCTAGFYDDLLAEPSISNAPIRFVATTLPGFGGTTPPDDLSVEGYSKLASRLAADLGCDAVVGHSLGTRMDWIRFERRLPAPVMGAALAGLFLLALVLFPEGSRAFIYFQF